MGWFDKWFGAEDDTALALYDGVVATARAPHWYIDGAVPDTVDGRFDMIAAVLAMVMLRLEGDPAGATPSARLTERFVTDMDGQLREGGVGDVTVGKHIGHMVSMLGGRLGAYRDGLAAGDPGPALVRNLYRGQAPDAAALAHVARELTALRARLGALPIDAVLAGRIERLRA